ncbi:putative prefoldin subunit 2 [Porphyridium purpureum]|uniref:Putative prefoldin subunit 2 n=1 Tax=Porphyridium purpureum TaxID=35688 RepID=A0A5J4YPI1_PORPP|nr:putative prefoldin subunit 2 [Porphyridium purpureum]|eukprot:POR9087..scf296_7
MSGAEETVARTEYANTRMELQELYSKVGALEADRSEHGMVLAQLASVPRDRRCWHQVGDVLCEQDVQTVQAALQANLDRIIATIDKLVELMRTKEARVGQLVAKYGFTEKDVAAAVAAQQQQ